MFKNKIRFFYLLAVLMGIISETSAQSTVETKTAVTAAENNGLFAEILHMDSVLFNAFNKRDIEKLKTLFTEDLEFYHDKDGLSGYAATIAAFKETASKNNDLRRELIIGSMTVYPIKDFGAMQVASHRFCHTENGKRDCGTFAFVHIWKKTAGGWKITRVISYGHKTD